ncbi:MAG: thioredoxin domain-containing protein, partial [Gammaproteobacteria bacterium]
TFYRKQREDIAKQNSALIYALRSTNPEPGLGELALNATPLQKARTQIEQSFDPQFGGFSKAPKFPHPTNIELLMRQWAHSVTTNGIDKADGRALGIARFTLQMMALGGLYDQLGGGFCRYSVDERWMIPHFEKMLYDNGPLLTLYAQAWAATREPLFRRIAIETAHWVMAEMQSPAGGYYSTLDADSEGHEGKFYAWTQDEVRALLSAQEYRIVARRFGLDRPANFEGKWHLHVFENTGTIAQEFGLPEEEVMESLGQARQKLFEARETRVHPGRDEKILTSWNGLMIKGMAVAGRLLNDESFIDSAARALDFIKATLWKDGRLLATYKDGKAHLQAYLDDYVFLIDAVLEFSQARWRDGDLAFAIDLAEVVLKHFQDPEQGGFFFTADDHERLIYRPKPVIDDATPAGNGIAATVLGRLGYLLGEPRYLDAAERTLKMAWPDIQRLPYAHISLLIAAEEILYPPQSIILRGEPQALHAWQRRCNEAYAPRRLAFAIPGDAENLPDALAARVAADEVVAYVCSGHTCSAPVMEFSELDAALKQTEAGEFD